ncbi:hypothetical protein F4604DRAFT_1929118 [Suillus subluteus]|nr:hypothetical protein F4604DRAFT_1929118 [Suillus subluteus]
MATWDETHLAQEHETLLDDGEFIWADSAYLTWVIAPYKKPKKDLAQNEIFNNHVSMLLKGLQVRIKDKKSHQFATYWIAACVGLHAFAMQCKADEHERDNSDSEDPFIAQGLSSDSDSDSHANLPSVLQGPASGLHLHKAKA